MSWNEFVSMVGKSRGVDEVHLYFHRYGIRIHLELNSTIKLLLLFHVFALLCLLEYQNERIMVSDISGYCLSMAIFKN